MGGAKLLGKRVAERGKGMGARRVGKVGVIGAWGKGAKGVESIYLNEVFNKTA